MIHRKTQSLFIGSGAHSRQDGAENLGFIDVHVGGDAVKKMRAYKEPVFIALQIEITAIDNQFRALIHACLHKPQDVFLGGLGHNGPEIDIIACGIGADLQGLDPRDKFFDQPICGFVTHWHGHGNRHAAFACRPITRADQGVSGLIHIGIGHDDHMVFCPAKALAAFACFGRPAINILRNRGRPHKAYGLNDLAVQDGIHSPLIAIDYLEHAIRQTRLFQKRTQHHRAGRITFRRFEDHRVARCQGRAQFPQGDHGGKVERRDPCNNAQRLAHGIHVNARACGICEFTLQQMRCADAKFNHL